MINSEVVDTLVEDASRAIKDGSVSKLLAIAKQMEKVAGALRKAALKPLRPDTGYLAMAPEKPYGVVLIREKKGEGYVIHSAHPARRSHMDGMKVAEAEAIKVLREQRPAAVRLLQVTKTWWRTDGTS